MTKELRVRDVFLFDLGPQIAAMPVSVESPVESEIQLCRTGDFYRADLGHFKVTRRTLERMVANAQERGVDIPINYYHLGSDPNARVEDRDAAGWVSPASLSVRSYKGGFALFGVSRWTAAAVAKIKDGKLRYISPEIVWSDVRMAASEAGPAGEPIGPQLTGAALVNDPFFTMNPVTLSRRAAGVGPTSRRAPRRFSMLSDAGKDKIAKLLKANGVAAEALEGLLAQIALAVMEDYKAQEPGAMPEAEVVAEEVMSAQPANAAASPDAAQALAGAREGASALAARVAKLEQQEAKRNKDEAEDIFGRYKKEGRFRIYAVAGSDPTGEKKATEHFAKGLTFFRAVFDPVTPLVGARAPQVTGQLPALPKVAASPQGQMGGDDQGKALHERVMAEIKAKGLKMTDYNRLADQFSRQ